MRSTIEGFEAGYIFDPRLPKVFDVWANFKENHRKQISEIGKLQEEEVAFLAEGLSNVVGRAIGLNNISVSPVNVENAAQLTRSLTGDMDKVIFMRHGEQNPPGWISTIPLPAVRKIKMMQDPFNSRDLLTDRGLVDAFTTAFGLLHIQQATGRSVHLSSSENMRAQEVAMVISAMIPGSTFSTQEGLNSITYQDERDDPPVTIEQLLDNLPSGVIPWNPEVVDRWCKRTRSGLSQSEVIVDCVGSLIQDNIGGRGNDLHIVLTHTQQLAEVLRSKGKLEDPFIRFPELTMLILEENSAQILPRGILAA